MKTTTAKKNTSTKPAAKKTVTEKTSVKKTPEKEETTKRIKTVEELGLKFSRFELFQKECLGSVRTMTDENGDSWFVGKDIADVLELKIAKNCYSRLEDSEKATISPTLLVGYSKPHQKTGRGGNKKSVIIVSESGMYDMIMSSRKEKAREFQRWITNQVLPSIAKNGFYHDGQELLSNEEREKVFLEARKTQAEIERLVNENQELRRENEAITKANKQINARASFQRDQNELLKEQIREMEDEKQLNYELNAQARARYERW